MNVILIFTYGISLKTWKETGLLKRELKIYELLNKNYNVEFTFLTFGDSDDLEIVKDYKFINVIPAKTIINFSKNRYIGFLSSFLLPFKIKKNLKNIDLIKTNQLNGAWIGIILKLILNKPLIIRTGYDALQFKIYEKKSKITILFYYLLTQISLIAADMFTVTSLADEFSFKKRFYFTKKLRFHPNYILETSNKPFEERYRNKILSVGRLEYQKNYLQLIKSLNNSNIVLDLVGEGSLKKSLESEASISSVKVNFLGNLSHDELLGIYKNYKIFISSSFFEGNPKAVLEAMSSGTLVVSYENNNIKFLLNHDVDSILFNDFSELKKIINNIFDDEKKYLELVENSYKKINNTYHINVVLKKEYAFYKELSKNSN